MIKRLLFSIEIMLRKIYSTRIRNYFIFKFIELKHLPRLIVIRIKMMLLKLGLL